MTDRLLAIIPYGIAMLVILWYMTDRWRHARHARAVMSVGTTDVERRPSFERHADFGPVQYLDIPDIERIRLAVIADQLAAPFVTAVWEERAAARESTGDNARAIIHVRTGDDARAAEGEGTESPERAVGGESTALHERAGTWESTGVRERADPMASTVRIGRAVPGASTEASERAASREGTDHRERSAANVVGTVAGERRAKPMVSTDPRERVLHWLEAFHNGGVYAGAYPAAA